MKHELDVLGGGSAGPGGIVAPVQALRGLQRNIDFQQVPHATVQQLHATIQHDFELVEHVCCTPLLLFIESVNTENEFACCCQSMSMSNVNLYSAFS